MKNRWIAIIAILFISLVAWVNDRLDKRKKSVKDGNKDKKENVSNTVQEALD